MSPIILLIEHDESLVYLIGRYAEQSGCVFAHAPSVAAARQMAERLQPALVVLNRLLVATADRATLAEFQTLLAGHDIPLAGYAQAAVAPSELGVDFDLALPLLYDDFCAALAALGVERHSADGNTLLR